MKTLFTSPLAFALAPMMAMGCLMSTASAATTGDANLFTGATAVASTNFGFTFNEANLVDGTHSAHVFADGVPNPAASITGFNSAIDSLRFFDTPSYSERIATDVQVHYSASSTNSLSAGDYTLLGDFALTTIDIQPNGEADYYTTFTSPGETPDLTEIATNASRDISWSEITGLGIPAGTQSVLLVFTPAAASNQGLGLSEIQAFAAVPEPASIVTLLLGSIALVTRSRQK